MPWDDKTKSSGPWGGEGGNNGGGKDGDSPWNRPGGSGGSGGNDLEEQMRRMQERFRQRGGGGGNRRGGGGGSGTNFGPLGFLVIAGIALLAWLSTSVVMVDPGQQASVFRFGKWQTNFGPGLHFHLPAPFEQHELVEVEARRKTEIGQTIDESLMLTEDENIVDLQFSVFWRVRPDAPQDYILNVRQPDIAVEMVAESVMREVVGKTKLQSVITTERDVVQNEVAQQVQTLLDDYRAGIRILSI